MDKNALQVLAEALEQLVKETVRDELAKLQKVTPAQMRLEAGLTVDKMAERSGISSVTISRIENGQIRHLRAETLGALSKALNRPDYISAAYGVRKPIEKAPRERK